MTLQLSGFTEKQKYLLQFLLLDLKQPNFNEALFNLLKNQLINHWENTDTNKSISQLFSFLSSTIQPKNPSSKNLAMALLNVTFEQFNHFVKEIFQHISIKVLIHGNWTQNHAAEINELVQRTFEKNTSANNNVKPTIINIESQGEITLPLILPEHDHATITYYPLPEKDLHSVAKAMLTSQLLSPLFFQEMRTEKQYGYLVGVNFIPINRYPGVAFYIQSPNTESVSLSEAIDSFIDNAHSKIEHMPDAHWEHLKHGLSSQLLERDSSLRIKSQRFWAVLSADEADFNQKNKLIDEINKLTLTEIKHFLKETLVKSNSTDRINLLSFSDESRLQKSQIKNKNIKNTLYLLNNCERK